MENLTFDISNVRRSWKETEPGVVLAADISIVMPDRNPSLMKLHVEARFLGGDPDDAQNDGLALLHALAERLRGELPPLD